MAASGSPPRARGSAFSRRAGYASPNLRISDAERAEVTDRLSKHYSDGRLDQTEYNERVDQALRAKTRADVSGLFADLPEIDEAGAPVASQPSEHPRPHHHILLLVLVGVIAVVAGRALMATFLPWWLLIGVVAFLLLRHGPPQRHRD